ncbi:MAG TPA: putative toxin-antitoxin system toxin component, PIN family [Candidatus Paceibacterota bacterium]
MIDGLPVLFLDANIFFAAVASKKGGSFFIIELAKSERIIPATSAYALIEAEKNIKLKLGERALMLHRKNILEISPYIPRINTTESKMEEIVSNYVSEKDIPIVLGAMESNADFLVTLDRKHLLDNEDLKDMGFGFYLVTPGDFLQKYFGKKLQ